MLILVSLLTSHVRTDVKKSKSFVYPSQVAGTRPKPPTTRCRVEARSHVPIDKGLGTSHRRSPKIDTRASILHAYPISTADSKLTYQCLFSE
jgi:hypothetical protein